MSTSMFPTTRGRGRSRVTSSSGVGLTEPLQRVVEAVQKEGTGRRVAIKYLGPDLVRTPDFLSRFRNQVLKLIELDVPSVVRVYDYAAQPGHGAAVVMELVNGVSLSDMIERQGPLDPEAALAR